MEGRTTETQRVLPDPTREALEESEQRYKRLLAATTDYIYTVNIEHGQTRSTYHGPGCEAVTGYSPSDFASDPYLWYRIIHAEDRAAVMEQIERILEGELPPPLEHRITCRDGSLRWIRNTTIPHRNGGKRLTAYDGLISDITERKRAEQALQDAVERLRQTNRELQEMQGHLVQAARFESIGTLAAGIAHEVKNPLQTILMGLHYLSQRLGAMEEAMDQEITITLSDMRESVVRASSIISDLLILSKATQFEMRRENLNVIIERCLRLIHTQLDRARVTVELSLCRALPFAELDQGRMQQVFVNLFLNSIQAMPSGGTLSVSSRELVLNGDSASNAPSLRKFQHGQRLAVAQVQDTGIGIKETDLPRIFDPFFTTKPLGEGTGLGLSMAKMIIERHGGVIEVQNRQGSGVLVTVALPAEQEDKNEK